MDFKEFPKSLYRGSLEDHVIVNDADEEAQARAKGYGHFDELGKEEPKRRGRPPKASE